MADVLMIIKTIGLEYDDRVRKEALVIKENGASINIVVLDDLNKKRKGSTTYNVNYMSISLMMRKVFRQAKGLVPKTIEMYIKFLLIIFKKKPSTVWIHNIEMAGLIPFLKVLKKLKFINRIVWDQHELPKERLISNKITNEFLKFCMRSSDKIIVANQQRKEYLIKSLSLTNSEVVVIDNYVDSIFLELPKGNLPVEVVEWLKGEKYLLAQGGAGPGRYLKELITAVSKGKKIKLIVVGPINNQLKNLLEEDFPNLHDYVLFTGLIPQMKLIDYIDNAIASIVMYSSNTMNSRLCSPNRLYQAISRGIPVIVGNNPPMDNLVSSTKSGVIMKTDGREVIEIENAIENILKTQDEYIKNAQQNKAVVNWESQIPKITKIFSVN